jgi:hypothetical protein
MIVGRGARSTGWPGVHNLGPGALEDRPADDGRPVQPSFPRLVDRQHGIFTRDQALTACEPAEIRGYLRRGRWRRTPWRGIYVDGEQPDELPTLIRSAALALGGDLVACHTTAAAIWGFDIRDDAIARAGALHFLGPPDLDNKRLAGLQVHPSSLGSDDAVLRKGVWCTPPERTACDVVRLGAPIDALATLDLALRTRTCLLDRLVEASQRQRGLRGVVLLGKALPHADWRAESPMESRMRWRFIDGGLPPPALQIEVREGGRKHRIDTGWEEALVGAEFDGLEAHRTPRQMTDDRDRHNWLGERGWVLDHFTAVHVYRRHEEMVEMVGRKLRRRRLTIMV